MGLATHNTYTQSSTRSSQSSHVRKSSVSATTHSSPRVSLVSNSTAGKNLSEDELTQELPSSRNNAIRTLLWFGIGAVAIVFVGVMTLIIFQPQPVSERADDRREAFYQQWR